MATAIENDKTQSGSITAGGQRIYTRNFHVTGAATVLAALAAPELPSVEDDITIDGVDLTFWGTRSWSRVAGHDELWMVACEYTSDPEPASGGGDELKEVSAGVRAVNKGVYRTMHEEPQGGYNNPAIADIGGRPVDVGGERTSVTFQEATLSIKEYVEYQPSIASFAGVVGKRNANVWSELTAGTVMFSGVRFAQNTSTGLWEIDYEYAIDYQTHHAHQVARTDTEGEVIPSTFGIGDEKVFVADFVYFVQPYAMTSFGGLPQA